MYNVDWDMLSLSIVPADKFVALVNWYRLWAENQIECYLQGRQQ